MERKERLSYKIPIGSHNEDFRDIGVDVREKLIYRETVQVCDLD
jgi:hypothetical protein